MTDLGRRAVAPTDEGEEGRARADAVLMPKVFGGFFRRYNKSKFPADHIAKNVLSQEFGVPPERTEAVLRTIRENGKSVGFIRETKTGPFVALDNALALTRQTGNPDSGEEAERETSPAMPVESETASSGTPTHEKRQADIRVFITHGKNKELVDQVKDILTLYDIKYEVAVERETTAIPVSEKVMAAMRRCQAGVMIVSADEQKAQHDDFTINTNVLIEIGAAFVLYDKKVVLLWDRRLRVPSNLQGLYRLEFEGADLSFSAGTRLAKAVKSLRE